MSIVHEPMDFFGLEAVDLHTGRDFVAILHDEIVKKHASVDVLPEDLIDSEAQVLLTQQAVNLGNEMVDNHEVFLFIFDFVIFALFFLLFHVYVQYKVKKR